MAKIILKKEELEQSFEYIDGQLWRKEYTKSNGYKMHKMPRRLINTNGYSYNGYCRVKFKGRLYMYHRIIYTLLVSEIPQNMMVDHINGDTSDNRLENLRLVSPRQNQQNRKKHRTGRLVGTSFHKSTNKWQAEVEISGKPKYLGLYTTEQEAHQAYINFLKENNI